jgi:hypothetical protein
VGKFDGVPRRYTVCPIYKIREGIIYDVPQLEGNKDGGHDIPKSFDGISMESKCTQQNKTPKAYQEGPIGPIVQDSHQSQGKNITNDD